MTTNRTFSRSRLWLAVLVGGVIALAAVAVWVLVLAPADVAQQTPPTTAGLTPATTRLEAADLTTTTTTTVVPPTTTSTSRPPDTGTAVTTTAPPVSDTEGGELPDALPDPLCDDGYHTHDGECHPDHPEPAEIEEGTEPAVTEEGAEATGLEDVMWWRPGLSDEAYALVDPDQVGADHVIRVPETREWGTYRYYLFYHGIVEGSATEDTLFWEAATTFRRTQQESSLWVYYPYRYDLAWVNYPTEMEVTATFPLGEELVVVLRRAGDQWVSDWESVEFPTGPPIRPTTPFAEPRFPDTAQALGRGCPPVEDLWEQDGNVTDPCTIAAVSTALDYAFTGPTAHRMAAVRDGHTLEGVFTYQDNIDDLLNGPFYNEAGRATRWIEVQSIRWAGSFPQASMVLIEYRSGRQPREMTDELRQAIIADHELYVEHFPDGESLFTPEWAIRFLEEGGLGLVNEALAVRTADGTWRLSYRQFCKRWITSSSWSMPDKVICSADPTPWFPDSHIFDRYIDAPNHIWYYTDPRDDPRETRDDTDPAWTYDRGGMEDHRLAGEYLGVPPT